MPHRNYEKGRRFEYKIVHELRDNGCIAFRTAGSHSPIDVVGIDENMKIIYLIQCKHTKASQEGLKERFNKSGTYKVVWKVMEK